MIQVPTIGNKRTQWLEALRGQDRNSIIQQLIRMGWDAAVFRVVNESRRLAPPAPEGGVELNGMIHRLFDQGFFALHMAAVRRLADGYDLSGKRGVYSLTGLLRDMNKHQALLTRGALFEAEGMSYDYEPIKKRRSEYNQQQRVSGKREWGVPEDLMWERIEKRHSQFDFLAGTTPSTRNASDSVRNCVFLNLQRKVDAAATSIVDHVRKFIAHAATPESRALVDADNIKLTLADLFHSHEQLCQVASFIAIYLLADSCPGFLPIPQFDHFKYIDRPLVETGNITRLRDLWRVLEKESHSSSQWGIDEYTQEFPNNGTAS